MRRAVAALLVAASLTSTPAVLGASRVAVVQPDNPDATAREATTRLEAELRGAGFDVVSLPAAPGADARAAVEAPPGEPRPIATIAIQGTRGGAVADVWVADHLSDKTLVRRIKIDDADPSRAVRTLAIRAVELLRASLLELREPRREPRPVPADVARWIQPPPAIAAPPPAAFHPAIEAGSAVLGSVTGFGATFGPLLRVANPAPLGTFVRASVFVGLSHPALQGARGSATLSQEIGTLELARPFGPFAGVLRPFVSLGAGAYALRAQGSAAPGRPPAESASTWAFAADAGAGVLVQLGAHVAVDVDLQALLLAPPPAVQLAGEDAARAGFPVLLGSLGLQLTP